MNWGKVAAASITLAAIAAGGGMWYAQEYGYYDSIDPAGPDARIAVTTPAGTRDLTLTDFQGIDADSSPLRWRACAVTPPMPCPSTTPRP